MTARRIDSLVLLFPDYDWSSSAQDVQLAGIVGQLLPNMSFAQDIFPSDLQTLTPHNAAENSEIDGFIYVPDLDGHDPCYNLSKFHIPANVTRRANLPRTDFSLIALAPWINAECTKSYLAAAKSDPCRAFLFYLPGIDILYNGTSWAQVSPASSPVWDLQDGGAWKSKTSFPVYAVSPYLGIPLMQASSFYSGNITDAPYGHDMTELGIDPRYYVRLYSQIYLDLGSGWSSIWSMLLVIGAVIFVVMVLLSIAMHLVHLVRRTELRRRVLRGEVDLQAMGLAPFRVPYAYIDNLPLWTYSCESALTSAESASTKDPHTTVTERQQSVEGPPNVNNTTETLAPRSSTAGNSDDSAKPGAHKFLPYTQPTCVICLEDYEAGVTTIRELPCGHIFHPECVDWCLKNHSSRCPMCKQLILPPTYCPRHISSEMVRRERQLRSLRARVTISEENGGVDLPSDAGDHVLSDFCSDIWIFLQPSSTPVADPDIPLQLRPPPAVANNGVSSEVIPDTSIPGNALDASHASGLSRQEVAQRRITQLLPSENFVDGEEAAYARQIPRWRRVMFMMFPGFT